MGHGRTPALDPLWRPPCPVCDGTDPKCTGHQFPDNPYPNDYPFLESEGGYDRHGDHDVQPRQLVGKRRTRLRWRS